MASWWNACLLRIWFVLIGHRSRRFTYLEANHLPSLIESDPFYKNVRMASDSIRFIAEAKPFSWDLLECFLKKRVSEYLCSGRFIGEAFELTRRLFLVSCTPHLIHWLCIRLKNAVSSKLAVDKILEVKHLESVSSYMKPGRSPSLRKIT